MSDRIAEVPEPMAPSFSSSDAASCGPWHAPVDCAIPIVVAASSPALLYGLESLVRTTPGIKFGGGAATLERLLGCCRSAGECVALVDPALGPDDVRELMHVLRASSARARFVLISDAYPPHFVREALKCGAFGFVEKTSEAAEIRAALLAAARGQRYLGANVTLGLAESLTLQELTAREMAVLRLLSRGDCNKVIARELAVTVGTVKTHMRAIMAKLDSRSRTDVVLKAYRLGLIRIA